MCIRDSSETIRMYLTFGVDDAIEDIVEWFFQRIHGRAMGPVSYTHLRAHETVLDLVCRLLLEKKNQSPRHCPLATLVLTEQHLSCHTITAPLSE